MQLSWDELYVAVCCSVLQCVAVCCCSVLLQYISDIRMSRDHVSISVHNWAEKSPVLQCVAVYCSVLLQCCCSILVTFEWIRTIWLHPHAFELRSVVCCSVLQYVVARLLQYISDIRKWTRSMCLCLQCNWDGIIGMLPCVALCCCRVVAVYIVLLQGCCSVLGTYENESGPCAYILMQLRWDR